MSSGSVAWSTGLNGVNLLQYLTHGVKTDSDGNSYMVVSSDGGTNPSGTRVLNPDGSLAASPYSSTSSIYFNLIIKRDSSGVYLGHYYVSGSNTESVVPYNIEIDSEGGLYLSGIFFGTTTLTVGSSFSGTTKTLVKNTNDYKSYFVKWNSSGVPVFAVNAISSRGSALWGLRAHGSHLYAVGHIGVVETSDIINANNGTSFRSISAGSTDKGVLIKYNLDGSIVWAFQLASASGAFRPWAIDLDSSGNIYVGGRVFTSATYTINNLSGTNSETSSGNSITISNAVAGFLLKYNSSGALQFRSVIDGVGTAQGSWESEQVFFMRLVGSHIYFPIITASGSTSVGYSLNGGTATSITSQNQSSVLFKIATSDGSYVWAVKATAPTTSNYALFDSIAVDESNNVYVTGGFNASTMTIADTASTSAATISRVGSATNGFVLWFNSEGVYQKKNIITNLNASIVRQPEINYLNGKLLISATISTSTAIYDTNNTLSATFTRNASETNVVSQMAITVFTVPDAPTSVSAVAGNGQAEVSFTAPVSDGGSAITGYTVTSSPGGFTATGASSPLTVTGLSNGTSYTFTVVATNAAGSSTSSSASSGVTPSTVPDAPTAVSAVAGNGQATVSFTAPVSDGGSAITGYTVTSSPGGFTATGASSPLTVTGLSNGTSYTFTVVATNAAGSSTSSSASSGVTPTMSLSSIAVSEGPEALSSYISTQPFTTQTEKTTVITDVRSALKNANFATTTEETNAKLAYIEAMRTALGGSSTFQVQSANFSTFTSTLKSVNPGLTPKPVNVVFPSFVAQSATIDLSTMDTSSYLHAEVPRGYTIILQNGAYSYSMTFNGTNFVNGETTISLSSKIILGDKTFTMIGIGSSLLQQDPLNNVVCLVKGTKIQTPSGNVLIETLRKGDMVVAGDNRIVPIKHIENIIVAQSCEKNAPYIVEKDAFGPNVPPHKLNLSSRHAIQIKADLWEVPREAAKENKKVYMDKSALGKEVVYYHIALPDYQTDSLVANGQVTECLNDGKYIETYEWNSDAHGYIRNCKSV